MGVLCLVGNSMWKFGTHKDALLKELGIFFFLNCFMNIHSSIYPRITKYMVLEFTPDGNRSQRHQWANMEEYDGMRPEKTYSLIGQGTTAPHAD